MFEPRLQLTNRIISLIGTIERQYGQIEAEPLIPSLSLTLTQENKILATHYSTSIEGNPLTQQEVTNILLEEKIPINKSEQEVKNYFRALNRISVISREKKPISLGLISDLHRYTMEGLEIKRPGAFRTSGVIVGHRNVTGLVIKHNPPAHTEEGIRQEIKDLVDWLNRPSDLHKLLKAGILHHRLAFIHPFFDGNGRVARLVTSYYLLLAGYEVTKYFILDDYYDMDRMMYSDKLHSADSGELNEWLEYFLEGISYSLTAALGRIRELSGKRLEEIQGDKRVLVSKREEEVLQIVLAKKMVKMSDVAEAFNVTRQQAHSLLQSLVAKGLLVKHGKTKKSYYELHHVNA